MKSFFKKLAFVMALAMVVSLAAPAAKTAVAAEEKELKIAYQAGMAITEVNLANVGDFEDLRFLYAPENWKELGVNWSSSNENVVTVDQAGIVTAVAAGSAIVTVAIGTESASVVVNVVDLPTYEVTIGLGEERSVTEKTLEIGESVDFAFYGIKDYSRDKIGTLPRYLCTWQSDDTTVLTKDDDAGKFTAVAAGSAKVTLTVANVMTGQTHNVIPVKVTVNAPVVEEPKEQNIVADLNKTQNTFEITFDAATDLGLADVEVFRVFFADDDLDGNGKLDDFNADKDYESVYVSSVTPDKDKLVYTVSTFDDFVDGVTYEVHVNIKDYKAERFVASVGDVAKVVVYEKSGASLETEELVAVPAVVDVTLFDAKGVNVTTRVVNGIANNDTSNVTYWLAEDSDAFFMSDYNEVSFYDMATAKVMATFQAGGEPVDSAEPCLIRPSKQAAYGVKRVVCWTLVDLETWPHRVADWNNEVHEVPAGEDNYVIATLLEDTRGNYFTTHQASATANSNVKYDGKTVYWTEDPAQAFWLNGYYVEYRAMNPDKMLVEDFGEIASYEVGNARFALYLYNQNNYTDDEFIKELYSQYVKVCHARKLAEIAAPTSTFIMTHTEADDDRLDGTNVPNAYFSLFSTRTIEVSIWENHGQLAGGLASEAVFDVELLTDTKNEALKTLVQDNFASQLNSTSGDKRWINFTATDFACTDKKQVTFKITEKVTGDSVRVVINLKTPNAGLDDTDSANVAVIREFIDKMHSDNVYEKIVPSETTITVDQAIRDYRYSNGLLEHSLNGYELLLKQVDNAGNEIGIENNIYLATDLNPNNISKVASGSSLKVGDRVLIVKDPSGKLFPLVDEGTYNNPAYSVKDGAFTAPASTSAIGVDVEKAGTAFNPVGLTTDYYQYNLKFRAVDDVTNELIYAKNGRYTLSIKTVKDINDETGAIIYTAQQGVEKTVIVNVTNSNAQVSYAGRTDTRAAEGESLQGYVDLVYGTDGIAKAQSLVKGNNNNMKRLILETFNFNLGSKGYEEAWKDGALYDGDYKLSMEDILYYTYTVTPSNKQVVINSVTFKVRAEKDGDNTDEGNAYGWYRSTATVNKSITFDYE